MNGTDRLTRTARGTADSPAIFVSSAPHSTLFLGFDLCASEGFDVQLNKVSHLLTTSCVNYHHLLSSFCVVLPEDGNQGLMPALVCRCPVTKSQIDDVIGSFLSSRVCLQNYIRFYWGGKSPYLG